MRVAIIPARGGSKRIARKNVRPFAGKPMLAYAVEAARAAGVFERIVVSTEDDEIARLATALGAEVPFMRPTVLADDHTPTVPVIADAIRACDELGRASAVCCIYPCVPLLRATYLNEALSLLQTSGAGYVFPVTSFTTPIQRALRRSPDGTTRPFWPEFSGTRSQDLEPAYHDAGQFYWGTRQAWLDGLDIHRNGRTVVIPEAEVVDIDTPADWARAEAWFRAANGSAA